MARELEHGCTEGLNHLPLVLQLGAGGHYDLAHVDPGHRALALSRGTAYTCLEPVRSDQLQCGQCLRDAGDVDGVELRADMRAIFATAFHQVCVGTNVSSLQGFSGNLPTFVSFRPGSKMWIAAAGTPQQKRDFAYS